MVPSTGTASQVPKSLTDTAGLCRKSLADLGPEGIWQNTRVQRKRGYLEDEEERKKKHTRQRMYFLDLFIRVK